MILKEDEKMKKIIRCLTLAMVLIVSCYSFAFADVDTSYVSIQEYENSLKAAYAQYGIEFSVLDSNGNVTVPRTILNTDLAKVEKVAKSFKITDIKVVQDNTAANSIMPLSMFYNKTVYKDWTIFNAYGSATMRSEANVTIDGSNSNIAAVNSKSTYQLGTFVNFDSWTTTNMTVTKNSPSTGSIKMVVSGRATFSYADPLTGIKTGYTATVSGKTLTVNCITF